ncbi:indigoidine synthase IndC [Pseudoalteromonas rubra]|uniref:Indigoidine synthase IndC n=1 Tax=Pseudoalteromonas rubra TaxID=43658 RepID=A0A4Q7EC29_9GAMM|nr:indigoidine synthase IndC [Pseudoalteromonas rubra]RZM80129.1 indigoidine synthase IndC [Pseudoalteromonas rubra]
MPHVDIHYFACPVSDVAKEAIAQTITAILSKELNCGEEVISVALCPQVPEHWQQNVYQPLITAQKDKLIKFPNY